MSGDFDFGASVILAQREDGSDILLAGQKSGDVFALDPDNGGALLWQRRVSLLQTFATDMARTHPDAQHTLRSM